MTTASVQKFNLSDLLSTCVEKLFKELEKVLLLSYTASGRHRKTRPSHSVRPVGGCRNWKLKQEVLILCIHRW